MTTQNIETNDQIGNTETIMPTKEVKPAWTPSEQVTALIQAISTVDPFDKKGIAAVVKASIDLRTSSKAFRDLAQVDATAVEA